MGGSFVVDNGGSVKEGCCVLIAWNFINDQQICRPYTKSLHSDVFSAE